MNTDVLDLKEVIYCHARLPKDGMVRIGYSVFHRGNTLEQFPHIQTFPSLNEAVSNLPDDGETFVITFPFQGTAERLWFTEEQEKENLPELLDIWSACYSKYPRSIYRG